MKKIFTILITLIILTGCGNKYGNSVRELESTIYKTYNHEEMVIDDGFNTIKKIFTDKDTFYHASLLTLEYGFDNTEELEKKIKEETNSFDVLYIKFSMRTGDVAYEAMESNHVYHYEAYLVKSYKDDSWHVYKMDGISELN